MRLCVFDLTYIEKPKPRKKRSACVKAYRVPSVASLRTQLAPRDQPPPRSPWVEQGKVWSASLKGFGRKEEVRERKNTQREVVRKDKNGMNESAAASECLRAQGEVSREKLMTFPDIP